MSIRICMCEGITYIGVLMRLGVYMRTYLVDMQMFLCKGTNGLLHIVCVVLVVWRGWTSGESNVFHVMPSPTVD